MSTISVPLNPESEQALDELVALTGSNKAAVVRRAIEYLREEEAVNAVLKAEQEVKEGRVLKGNPREVLA